MKTLTNRIFPSLALGAAILALAACNKGEEVDNTAADNAAENVAEALPPLPMIKASHTYRCKDNSLIFVDFMTDDKTANLRTAKDAPVTPLTAPEAGQPYASADGKSTLEGQGETITYNGQSCKTG